MNILKNTFAILALSIVCSCSKDDVAATPQATANEPVNLLTKESYSVVGYPVTASYSYDSNKRFINSKSTGPGNAAATNRDFFYNADGTLDKIFDVVNQKIDGKYFYDADKRLIKKERRNGDDVYLYFYSGNQVTEKYAYNGVDKWIQIYTNNSDGNVSESKSYDQITAANPNGLLSGTYIYTYDDKKSPYLAFPKEIQFPFINKNNLLTRKVNAEPVSGNSYEYNAKGYPTKQIANGDTRIFEY